MGADTYASISCSADRSSRAATRDEGIAGMRRFVERLFNLVMEEIVDTLWGRLERAAPPSEGRRGSRRARYNTAIAATMGSQRHPRFGSGAARAVGRCSSSSRPGAL